MKTYLFKSGEYLKIGRSTDVYKRLRMVRTMNPIPVELLAVVDNDIERELHKLFAPHRVNGEWFFFRQQIVDVFQSYQEQPGKQPNEYDLIELPGDAIEAVFRRVYFATSVSKESICGKSRDALTFKARVAVVKSLRNELGLGLGVIGKIINRDHTTIIHALKKP